MEKKEYIEQLKNKFVPIEILKKIDPNIKIVNSKKNPKISCPYHTGKSGGVEKTPSLLINPDGHFYCFGCSKTGEFYELVSKILDIPEESAIKMISFYSGIELVKAEEKKEQVEYKKKMRNHNKRYYKNLSKNKNALEYLKSREITIESIKNFKIGVIDKEEFKFRENLPGMQNRITFPIYESKSYGPVYAVGFAYGDIEKGNPNKYINEENSEFFNKSNLLYGFNLAVENIKKKNEAILVEGYFDVISMHQSGFNNTVATMGLSISEYQLNLLSKLTDTITVYYDDDEPAKKARITNIQLMYNFGFNVNVIITEGNDPDDFCKKNNFDNMILTKKFNKKKEVGIKNLINQYTQEFENYIFKAKYDILKQLSPLINSIEDDSLKKLFLNDLKKKIDI